MDRARARPRVEELESRTLPSTTALAPPALAPALAAGPHRHAEPALDGDVSGHYSVPEGSSPDLGQTYTLKDGSGTVGRLGHVTVKGSLQSTGFMVSGRATGSLTLTGAHGSVTLDLLGPLQQGFAPLPGRFSFTVKSGTRAYAHFHATGTVTVHLDAAHHTFTLDVEPTAGS